MPPSSICIGREFAPKGAAMGCRTRTGVNWRATAAPASIANTTSTAPRWSRRSAGAPALQHVIPISGRIPSPADYADPGERAWVERALRYQGLEPGARAQDVRIDAAYIGSCTNARLSDLREAAAVLKGRKVAAGVTAICVPGGTQVKRDAEAEGLDHVFLEAGFRMARFGLWTCAPRARTVSRANAS